VSTLGVPVPRDDWPVSNETWLAIDAFTEWVHMQPCEDTARMLMMLTGSLLDERDRYRAALIRHDHAAMDESAAEQRDLVALIAVCRDHLAAVGYVPSR
jgi:hypothetical protein